MSDFMNIDGDGAQARDRRNQSRGGGDSARDEGAENGPRARRPRDFAGGASPDTDPLGELSAPLWNTPSLTHPLRDVIKQVREELRVFGRESNRESAPFGFSHRGPEPVSMTLMRACCREAAALLEQHVEYMGDGSAQALKMRLLAVAVQTELQEFDIYLTHSNFRGGVVGEGDLANLLTVVNALSGNLGQRLVEFDAVQRSLDG